MSNTPFVKITCTPPHPQVYKQVIYCSLSVWKLKTWIFKLSQCCVTIILFNVNTSMRKPRNGFHTGAALMIHDPVPCRVVRGFSGLRCFAKCDKWFIYIHYIYLFMSAYLILSIGVSLYKFHCSLHHFCSHSSLQMCFNGRLFLTFVKCPNLFLSAGFIPVCLYSLNSTL